MAERTLGQPRPNRLRNIVVDDHGRKQNQKDKSRLVDAFLDVQADIAAHQTLNKQQENNAAIHDWDGEQVKDPKIQADDHGEDKQWYPAFFLRCCASLLGNADGARNCAKRLETV